MTAPTPITPWAPDANYPSGSHAWSGTPTKVSPAYTEFQPSPAFAPSAQEFNSILAARDAKINAIIAYVGQTILAGLLNWEPATINLSGNTPVTQYGFCWNPSDAAWIALIINSAGVRSLATTDGGATWKDNAPEF